MSEKYYLKSSWQKEYQEVTKEQFMEAEKNAGFHSKFEGEPVTAGFGGSGIQGKIVYENKKELGIKDKVVVKPKQNIKKLY
jgi:hypothetical protein